MNNETMERDIARRSAILYIPISLGIAILFYLSASLIGSYPPVARFGGMVWVGLLSLIVSMPLITSKVKKQVK